MSPTVVALLFTIGSGGWVYTKIVRRSGQGNMTPVLVVTGISSAILFMVSDWIFHVILK